MDYTLSPHTGRKATNGSTTFTVDHRRIEDLKRPIFSNRFWNARSRISSTFRKNQHILMKKTRKTGRPCIWSSSTWALPPCLRSRMHCPRWWHCPHRIFPAPTLRKVPWPPWPLLAYRMQSGNMCVHVIGFVIVAALLLFIYFHNCANQFTWRAQFFHFERIA